MVIYIEHLTLVNFLTQIIFNLRKIRKKKIEQINYFYIDATRWGLILARILATIWGFRIRKLEFQFSEIKDDRGLIIGWRILFQDLAEIQAKILNSKTYRDLFRKEWNKNSASYYIEKSIATTSSNGSTVFEPTTLWKTIYLIQVVCWHMQKNQFDDSFFFLVRRCWMECLSEYAQGLNILLIPTHRPFNWKCWLRNFLYEHPRFFYGLRNLKEAKFNLLKYKVPERKEFTKKNIISVQATNKINVEDQTKYSDLFFLQPSQLPASDIIVFVERGRHITEEVWTDVQKNKINIVALSPTVTSNPDVPVYLSSFKKLKETRMRPKSSFPHSLESRFLRSQISSYNRQKNYWLDFFRNFGVKVAITECKASNEHMVMADALEELGGVSTIWQRSFEEFSSPNMSIGSDISFNWSNNGVEIGKINRSKVSYYVATGYPGDHRFSFLKKQAQVVRSALHKNGAEKIIGFFDEATLDDERWWFGHSVLQSHYLFLLEKVLANPWLGIVVKPKKPDILNHILGEVSELLYQAEKTGRCYIFRNNLFPPAGAALAADIAIGDNTYAATAGIEAALTKVPTLLLDCEGWNISRLYNLGIGKVIFQNHHELWDTLIRHWNSSRGIDGLGDWSPLINELDPFRDGRAAERIGTYLMWLNDGLRAGLSRDTVMADAAERYCKIWGKDKIQGI